MNCRIPVLAVILALAGFLTVSGAFSQSESQSKRPAINSPDRSPQAPYSTAILVGDTLYMAGNIGHDAKTGKVPQKIEDEIKLLLDGYKSTLAQANMTMDDLVYVQTLFKVHRYSTVCSRGVYLRYTVARPRVTVQPR